MESTFFVHPGYLRRRDAEDVVPFQRALCNTSYGSYEDYLSNLKRLYATLSRPAIFLAELENDQLHSYHGEFQPRVGDVVLQWVIGEEGIHNFFSVGHFRKRSWQEQRRFPEVELHLFLNSLGIDAISLAGEFGPYGDSFEGCVGRVYGLLERNLPVHGVYGCVFPLIPYTKRLDPVYRLRVEQEIGEEAVDSFMFQERLFRDLYGFSLETK